MKWLGIDIAKRKFDLAVLNNGKIRSKVFDNTSAGYDALLAWLATQGYAREELHACMEATSVYYEKLATFLYDAGIRVSVVNPLQIKAFGESLLTRQKTDRADAVLIARAEAARQPELHLHADRNTRYEAVASLMASAQQAGLVKIAFVTDPVR